MLMCHKYPETKPADGEKVIWLWKTIKKSKQGGCSKGFPVIDGILVDTLEGHLYGVPDYWINWPFAPQEEERPEPSKPSLQRINEYLSNGGLFNPESMQHSYVRDLLLDVRDHLLEQPTGTEAAVCKDIADRQQHGLRKYGVTVKDNPLNRDQWLQHLYEELMDGAVYAKRLQQEMQVSADEVAALEVAIDVLLRTTALTADAAKYAELTTHAKNLMLMLPKLKGTPDGPGDDSAR